MQANSCSDSIEVYGYLHGRGVGTQAAALYIDWARQYEEKGQLSQAETVYHRALESKAQPQDSVLQQYRSESLLLCSTGERRLYRSL